MQINKSKLLLNPVSMCSEQAIALELPRQPIRREALELAWSPLPAERRRRCRRHDRRIDNPAGRPSESIYRFPGMSDPASGRLWHLGQSKKSAIPAMVVSD
jgi:hypothetical protein